MKGAPLISLISPRPLSGGPNASQAHFSHAGTQTAPTQLQPGYQMSLHYISKQGRAREPGEEAAGEREAWEGGIISNSPWLRHKSEAFRTQIIPLRPSVLVLLQPSTLLSQTDTPAAFPWQIRGGICTIWVQLQFSGVFNEWCSAHRLWKNSSSEFTITRGMWCAFIATSSIWISDIPMLSNVYGQLAQLMHT